MTDYASSAAERVTPRVQHVETADTYQPVQAPNRPSREVSVHPFDELSKLAPEWEALAARTGASPYLRPGWIAAWWRAFGTGNLEIHALWKDQHLAAVVPVERRPGMLASLVNGHSPRFGLLAQDLDSATELAQTLFIGRPRRVSIGALDSADISLQACTRAAEKAGYRFIIKRHQTSPYLEIKGTVAEYKAKSSKRLRANLRRCQRRLEERGTVAVHIIDGSERLDEYLEDAFSTEAANWKGENHTAIQSNPDTKQFYTDIAHWAAAEGMFRIFFLRLNQRPIAMNYGLIDNGTCFLPKCGYDETYSRCSPGKVLRQALVEHCFAEKLSFVDFHGDANAYKFQWANAVHEQKRFEAYAPSLAGNILWVSSRYGRPVAKSILHWLGLRKVAKKVLARWGHV